MATFFTVFGLSFLTALSGALQPGPLLTYTIAQTLRTRRHGWLTGARIIAGHAAIEAILIVGLILGLAALLTNKITVWIIGSVGTAVLLLLAVLTLLDVFVKKVALPTGTEPAGAQKRGLLANPYFGGALISMSNPFWWIWWATLGFFFMRQYEVSFLKPDLLFAFFIGHEAGDLGWYMLVSIMTHTGRRWLNQRVYHVILIAIAAALVGFAAYLLYSTFRYNG